MKPWNLRSPEIANLLNPAFCGHLLYSAVKAHHKTSERALPYALTFIILPLALHLSTMKSIDGRIRQFHVWLNRNQQVKIGFARRAQQIVPFTREALTFLLQAGALTIQADSGVLVASPLERFRRSTKESSENVECVRKAEILGRWMASAGAPATIFASLGVKP